MHARATSSIDVAGRIQPPWPRTFGTPPWAVANQLTGTSGTSYRSVPVRWRDGGATYDELVGLTRPAALYVGNAWLPRHVVLVLEGDETRLRVGGVSLVRHGGPDGHAEADDRRQHRVPAPDTLQLARQRETCPNSGKNAIGPPRMP